MTIQEIFASDVARDIPPVIHFDRQEPEKLRDEVNEYIITGGYEEGDPRKKRTADGIHEQYVRLLKSIRAELDKPGGPELPACWISGFYGSGKSSFAKLLGLSLDHRTLPDGRALSEALLARDDSPRRAEFQEAWKALVTGIDSMAVVFDIGAVARDDEQIHSAVKRQLALRLDYCSESHNVADYELKLEQDGRWDEFLSKAQEILGRPWELAKREKLAEDYFSEVMHHLMPTLYEDPISWLDVRTGQSGGETGVDETVRAIEAMMTFRAPGKTLFLVVDEVSQYIHQNENRMLKLQSLVGALGQRLQGKAWILATGQQKLEEDLEGGNLSKMKDRFLPRLRVHLAPTNIRDVVHKRLLKKRSEFEEGLRELYEQHKSDLKLYGYKCGEITERDFMEVYPMLPGHIDLLMLITSNLRARSSRMKGDDHAIRGLLQLLGELFREQKLGEKPFGSLVTLDQIYDVQYTALDADVQNTMARLHADEELAGDELAVKAAKAVALLELIQEQEPTTPELVAQCLYGKVGAGSLVESYQKALDRLYKAGLLSRSEKQGYKIQSTAGQEWARERDSYKVTGQAISDLVREMLRNLLGQAGRPRFKSRPFPVAAVFTDDRGAKEERLQSPNDAAVVSFEFQYLRDPEARSEERWLKDSDSEQRHDRVVWVCGSVNHLETRARDLIRSRHMVNRFGPRQQSLPEGKRRLLFDEQNQRDFLEGEVQSLVADCFLDGALYFRAQRLSTDQHGSAFKNVVEGVGSAVLPRLYEYFIDLAVTDGELKQLLEVSLSGVDRKFLEEGLGLFKLDAGKYVPSCEGEAVKRIKTFIDQQQGLSGSRLLQVFGGAPYGYPPDVVKACVLGLMRGGQVALRLDNSKRITSVRDPGTKEVFLKDKEFKKAEVLPGDPVVKPRDLVAIRKFFENALGVSIDNDPENLADAAFDHFEKQRQKLDQLQRRINSMNPRPVLPKTLANLADTMARCVRSRLVEETLLSMIKYLDELRSGFQDLGIYLGDLTDESMELVLCSQRVSGTEYAQLEEYGVDEALRKDGEALQEQLDSSKPWLGAREYKEAADRIQTRYREIRQEIIIRQETEAEERRSEVKLRNGFAGLKEEQQAAVLRPIREALQDTTAEAISPTLCALRDAFPARLQKASEECNRLLDQFINDNVGVQVVEFSTGLYGRELNSTDEVERMLDDLRGRLLDQLKKDVRIRLV